MKVWVFFEQNKQRFLCQLYP